MLTQTMDFFDQARTIEEQLRGSCLTQEQLSVQLGVSQSYIANKLRLLRFSPAEQSRIRELGLTERHCRALLRFPDASDRARAMEAMAERSMNVAQAEEYVEALLCASSRADELRARPPEIRSRLLLREIRQFCISIDRSVEGIRKCGVSVESTRTDTDDGTVIRIRLPKAI